ncbi:MAG: tRNA pseudouridine(55) synthase TruB [Anaerocolumna sp.]
MINGIINVHKEQGFTSHDVVAKLRRIIGQKKIGHTGTLDPDATGVLPVCLGNATKLCDMLTDKSKTYEAVLLLGKTTDTQDIWGKLITENNVTATKKDIEEAVLSFVGEYDQIPPMYSAIKVGGKRLYELARQGVEIERESRKVCIHSIKILEVKEESHEIRFLVDCSKGTYIRTLCQDIGEKLQCGGCMKSLVRTKVGSFLLEKSLTLNEIEEKVKNNELDMHLVKTEEMFPTYRKVKVGASYSKYIYNGNCFPDDYIESMEEVSEITNDYGTPIRVYDWQNVFIGIYEYNTKDALYKPVKMFL